VSFNRIQENRGGGGSFSGVEPASIGDLATVRGIGASSTGAAIGDSGAAIAEQMLMQSSMGLELLWSPEGCTGWEQCPPMDAMLESVPTGMAIASPPRIPSGASSKASAISKERTSFIALKIVWMAQRRKFMPSCAMPLRSRSRNVGQAG
jgi:hypothetical protein